MNNYELLFILDSGLTDEVREAIISKLSAVITEDGGSIETVDKWGVKKLAYPIFDKTEGFYCLFVFHAKSDVPAELDRVMRITDGVVRGMITTKN